MRPTREEIQIQLKRLPSDKAACPDSITNRILQTSGERAVDMIYMYMLIIWEVQTYPGAWALALMQPIYKCGEKDRHCPSSYRGIYLLNTLTKLFEGLIESRLSQFTEKFTLLRQHNKAHAQADKYMMPYTRTLPPYNRTSRMVFPDTVASSTLLQHIPLSAETD